MFSAIQTAVKESYGNPLNVISWELRDFNIKTELETYGERQIQSQ